MVTGTIGTGTMQSTAPTMNGNIVTSVEPVRRASDNRRVSVYFNQISFTTLCQMITPEQSFIVIILSKNNSLSTIKNDEFHIFLYENLRL